MGHAHWVFLMSFLLATMAVACLSPSPEEEPALQPTLILTPFATVTPTPAAVPTQPPTATPTSTPETWTYKVKAGDTLSGIAAKYGVSVKELMALNSLHDGDYLVAGQELRVPKGQP